MCSSSILRPWSRPDCDQELSLLSCPELIANRHRNQTIPFAGLRRGIDPNPVGTSGAGHGGSHVPCLGGTPRDWAACAVGGRWSTDARGAVDDAHWTGRCLSAWASVGEEKCTPDDPAAAAPLQGYASRRGASEVQGREPNGDRRRTWRHLGQACRARAYRAYTTWRDRMVGAGRGPARADGPEPGHAPRCDAGVGVGRLYCVTGTRVGATGPGRITKTTMATDRRAVSTAEGNDRAVREDWARPRPTRASVQLARPMSMLASTSECTRSSGRLDKRRPKSAAMAGERAIG